ncbi:hypothetical protein AURDEDRAFT_158157 [Auricularia subglabra TFB-10046 SS5]|nr:hypothetical protein AURDEDRAFT_158157 [Auricularia subglabra TFB-10046 SS5]
MSARARFVPGGAAPPAQARQQPSSSSSDPPPSSLPDLFVPRSSQPSDGESIARSASRATDNDSARPLNLKKLTNNKKSTGRAAEHRAPVPPPAASSNELAQESTRTTTSIASPNPRRVVPSASSLLRPSSPTARSVTAAMLPPPAPPTAYNQARPKSRAAHIQQQQQHLSPFDPPPASQRPEHYPGAQTASNPLQDMDYDEPDPRDHHAYVPQRGPGQNLRTSVAPPDPRMYNGEPETMYRNSPARRSMSTESNVGSRRFPDEHDLDSPGPPAKRMRVDDALQHEMHYSGGGRGTSPLSDADPMPEGLNSGPSTQNFSQQRNNYTHPFQQLLGNFDLTAFAGAHAKQYELDVAKWEASSHAEWEAHASVLAEQYNKCIEMVKQYMGRKIQLYSSLKGTTDKQRAILQKRDKGLEKITDSLAKQAKSVVAKFHDADSGS